MPNAKNRKALLLTPEGKEALRQLKAQFTLKHGGQWTYSRVLEELGRIMREENKQDNHKT